MSADKFVWEKGDIVIERPDELKKVLPPAQQTGSIKESRHARSKRRLWRGRRRQKYR